MNIWSVGFPSSSSHGSPSPLSALIITYFTMKLPLLSVLAISALADAHYIFGLLVVNNKQIGTQYEYFRKNTNSNNPGLADIITSPDLRCNKGAKPGGGTKTYEVKPGDLVGAKVFNANYMAHPGPAFVYMSKAPDSVATYDGSGDWFKVYETGLCGKNPGTDTDWCMWNKDRVNFTVPAHVPPGEYLVRFEHIGLHEAFKNRPQFYIGCAQLKISGPGGGTPGPLVKFPGAYNTTEPGIHYDKWASKPAPYVMPGPPVWDGN